jgi:hypothetical protein
LRDEAYYINKLERLLKGEEPKSEKKNVQFLRFEMKMKNSLQIKSPLGFDDERNEIIE